MSDPPSAPSAARKRPGYPLVPDPEHPLWKEQQNGWPSFSAIEAMAEAVRLSRPGAVADSRSHPAFDSGYIVNREASRPAEEAPPTVAGQSGEQRR